MQAAAVAPEKGTTTKDGRFFSFYTKGEEVFNAVSHIAGGALGLVFWIVLAVLAYPDVTALVAVSLFGFGAVALYTMSALYHFLPDGKAKGVFRIFDHCTIFLLIAGTYSPFCLIALGGTAAGWTVFALQWACAAAGITMNAIAMNNKVVKAVSMALYVVEGWMALAVFGQLLASVSAASLYFLLAGGIAYTVGIVFFALGKKTALVSPRLAPVRHRGHRAAVCQYPASSHLKNCFRRAERRALFYFSEKSFWGLTFSEKVV